MSKINFKKLLKITGLILGPLLPLTVAVYFLFPYINEQQYQEVMAKYEDKKLVDHSAEGETIGEDFATLKERANVFQKQISDLKLEIDSLQALNDSLKSQLLAKEKRIEAFKEDTSAQKSQSVPRVDSKEFAQTVKSLLSLDDENLAPILNEMTNNQLVRLYRGGSSLQRRKLLRSLKSKRAAKLMTEVM